jgi:hypothetical protein
MVGGEYTADWVERQCLVLELECGKLSGRTSDWRCVFEPYGHEFLSQEAIREALKDLPPKLQWIRRFLEDANTPTVYRDLEDVWNGGQWNKEGQKNHFMRYATDSELTAYEDACTWIFKNGFIAAQHLRDIWQKKLGYYNPIYVTGPLGDAMHALQDSFSAAHVKRVKRDDVWVIEGIYVYNDANKKASGTYPGHEALDKQWKGTELGNEAITACRELIRIVIHTSLLAIDATVPNKWQSLWDTFSGLFLSCGIKEGVPVGK